MFKSFEEYFYNRLQDEHDRISDQLINGSCKSFDDYRYKVGVLDGIAISQRVFEDLQDKMEKSQDERARGTKM